MKTRNRYDTCFGQSLLGLMLVMAYQQMKTFIQLVLMLSLAIFFAFCGVSSFGQTGVRVTAIIVDAGELKEKGTLGAFNRRFGLNLAGDEGKVQVELSTLGRARVTITKDAGELKEKGTLDAFNRRFGLNLMGDEGKVQLESPDGKTYRIVEQPSELAEYFKNNLLILTQSDPGERKKDAKIAMLDTFKGAVDKVGTGQSGRRVTELTQITSTLISYLDSLPSAGDRENSEELISEGLSALARIVEDSSKTRKMRLLAAKGLTDCCSSLVWQLREENIREFAEGKIRACLGAILKMPELRNRQLDKEAERCFKKILASHRSISAAQPVEEFYKKVQAAVDLNSTRSK